MIWYSKECKKRISNFWRRRLSMLAIQAPGPGRWRLVIKCCNQSSSCCFKSKLMWLLVARMWWDLTMAIITWISTATRKCQGPIIKTANSLSITFKRRRRSNLNSTKPRKHRSSSTIMKEKTFARTKFKANEFSTFKKGSSLKSRKKAEATVWNIVKATIQAPNSKTQLFKEEEKWQHQVLLNLFHLNQMFHILVVLMKVSRNSMRKVTW